MGNEANPAAVVEGVVQELRITTLGCGVRHQWGVLTDTFVRLLSIFGCQ